MSERERTRGDDEVAAREALWLAADHLSVAYYRLRAAKQGVSAIQVNKLRAAVERIANAAGNGAGTDATDDAREAHAYEHLRGVDR